MRRYRKLFTIDNPFGGPPLLVAALDQQDGWGENDHWVFTCEIMGGAAMIGQGRTLYMAHNTLRRPPWKHSYKRPMIQVGLTKDPKMIPYAEGL